MTPSMMPGGGVPPEPKQLVLPELREDLRLLPAPRDFDGSPSWRIHDAIRNQFYEIGWLEFELLSRWRGHQTAATLVEAIADETPLATDEDEIADVIEFLRANELLSAASSAVRGDLRKRNREKKRPWYESMLHNYLFFRLPLVRPDRFLKRTLPFVEIFFTRGFAILVGLVFLADLFLVMREWHAFHESFVRYFSLKGIFYYAVAATFAKVIHELGHAYVARRYGVRIPAMGLAFLVMWPYLYTDTAETWKLADRRKQLAIASAGMLSELVVAIFATLAWAVAPDGAVKSILFILATTTWIMTLAINASPFMRFDGYFVLSDALDFPNLHERGGACSKWWMRTTFWRMQLPKPEPHITGRNRFLLVSFAIFTWVYRITVFIGIAVLVYHFVIKLLGIFLFLVEVIWFIVMPFAKEAAYLWKHRQHLRPAWQPMAVSFALLLMLLWAVPVSNQVNAPAIIRAEPEQSIYAPFAAQLKKLAVHPGQEVKAGDVLAVLDSPDLVARWRQAEVSIHSARVELQRTSASQRQQEQLSVLQEQLARAEAEQQAVAEDAARLEVRAGFAGTIRDVPPDLVEGRWVTPRHLMMRLVADHDRVIEAFLSESQIGTVDKGARVKFYPALPEAPVLRGVVTLVDKTPSRVITRPLLASTYGGDLAAVRDPKDGLVAFDATFRVLIRPDPGGPVIDQVSRGTVRIETGLTFVAQNFVARAISIVIRESGF